MAPDQPRLAGMATIPTPRVMAEAVGTRRRIRDTVPAIPMPSQTRMVMFQAIPAPEGPVPVSREIAAKSPKCVGL